MNDIIEPFCIQELHKYTKDEISQRLSKDIVKKLENYNFIEIKDNQYQFNYVGILIIDNDVIYSYPKYVPYELDEQTIKNHFKEVLKVIKKYLAENEEFEYENDDADVVSFDMLSLMISILEDYYEYGVYNKIQNILESNGNGEIEWNKTINNIYPIIDENRPYYLELYTKNKINNLFYYFKLLHECIITTCSNYLKSVGLLEMFDLPAVELSDMNIFDFGDDDFILNKLSNELFVEYNTHKQEVLMLMYQYISKKNIFSNENYLMLFGTPKYENIWEKMCSEIFSNKLKKDLINLKLNYPLKEEYKKFKSLYDVIEYPKWILNDGTGKKSKGKLEPDIITFEGKSFIILDAKYYNLIFEKYEKLKHYPGINDITKQYLYQLAFEKFRKDHGYDDVKNALLFPFYDNKIKNRGCVKIEFISSLSLTDIQVIMLPVSKINKYYLENKKIKISDLNLWGELMDKLKEDLDDLNDSISDLENQIQNAKTEAENNIKSLKIELSQVKSDKSDYARKNDFDSVQNCRIKENNLKFKIDAQWNTYSLLNEKLFKLNKEKVDLEKQIKLEEDKIKRNNELRAQIDNVLNNYKKTQNLKLAAIDSNINPNTVEQWYEWGKNNFNETYSYFYTNIIEIDNYFMDMEALKLKKQMDSVVEAYKKTNSLKKASKIANISYDVVMYWYEWGSKGFGKENTYFFKKIDNLNI